MNRIGIFFFSLLFLVSAFQTACTKHPHHTAHAMPDATTETAAAPTSDTTGSEPPSPESPYQDISQIEPGNIVHLKTGQSLSESQVIDMLAPSRIIYAGEVHDSVEDHRMQLKILKGLVERFPGQVVVGMEMFRRSSQDIVSDWFTGDLPEKEFLKRWYEEWGHNAPYYDDLLAFLKKNRIPVIALRPTAEMNFKMRQQGMDGLSENDKKKLPEIDDTDPYHRKAVEAVFSGHGPMAMDQFEAFYQMMLFWEETMAENIANYLSSPEGQDKKMMVMAGGFHVGYGFGIPRRTFRRLPVPYQIVLTHSQDFPEEKKMKNVTAPDLPLPIADFVWGVSYTEGVKPVRLGVMLEKFQGGVRIEDVFPDSAADKAGIKRGDIVTIFDGISVHERFDIIYQLKKKKPGDRVKIKLVRNGEVIETEALMSPSAHP